VCYWLKKGSSLERMMIYQMSQKSLDGEIGGARLDIDFCKGMINKMEYIKNI